MRKNFRGEMQLTFVFRVPKPKTPNEGKIHRVNTLL